MLQLLAIAWLFVRASWTAFSTAGGLTGLMLLMIVFSDPYIWVVKLWVCGTFVAALYHFVYTVVWTVFYEE